MSLGADIYGVVYEKGEIICQEGDPGDCMYIIQSGAVEITRQKGSQEVVVAMLEQGDFFGEMALLDQQPRSATVKTMCRTRLLPLTRDSFLRRAYEDPEISLHLIKALSQRIDKTSGLLRQKIAAEEELAQPSADGAAEVRGEGGQTGKPQVRVDPERSGGAVHDPNRIGLMEEGQSTLAFLDLVFADLASGQQYFIYEDRQPIFRQGDPGSPMYLVLQGAVEIRQEREGTEVLVARLQPPDFFGEVALLTGLPHAATALAAERTCLLPVGIEQLLHEVRKNIELALYLVRSLILRLRHTLQALADLEKSVSVSRLALPPLLKKKEPISLAVVSLSSCGGCSAALLDNQAELEKLLERANVVYCPMLMDQGELGEVDVALIDGIIRVKEDEEKVKEAREKCRFLVAWGTCAAFGGIPAIANLFELEELIEASYGESQDPLGYYLSGNRGAQRFMYQAQEFGLLRRAYPAAHVVRVDYYLPGCPPPVNLLTRLVGDLTGEGSTPEPRAIICAECQRKPKKADLEAFTVFSQEVIDPQLCFLSLGTVCLGSLTRGGCGAICTRGGLPCWGCRGPAAPVLKKMTEGDTYQEVILNTLKQRSRLSEEILKPVMRTLRSQSNSSLAFEQNLVSDLARLR
jgi:F420-non-reducing hydrogenase small subunit